jgi:UDP-N-acetylmuramoyl-L-alanyl-D-glutamate--2,6-diaminopimelate ligase
MSSIISWLKALKLSPTAQCTLDSRAIQPGDVFVAIQGEATNGANFMMDAIQRGAAGILSEQNFKNASIKPSVPFWQDPNLKKQLPDIAAFFYGNPTKRLSLCGITGTNGKTSVAHTIAQLWDKQPNQRGAILGTLGIGPIDRLSENKLTTPDVLSVYRYLKACADKGATQVAIEASSHALVQGRVAGLSFESVVLTNVTQDHLDYHKTMASYWQAKRRLLTDYPAKHRIINLDDPYGLQFCQDCRAGRTPLPTDTPMLGYSCHEQATGINGVPDMSSLTVKNIQRLPQGISAECHSPWGRGDFHIPGIGDFQLSNALAAIGVLCSQGADFASVLDALSHSKPVPGRLNKLGGQNNLPTVIIDFAHTPDALAQVLHTLRPYCAGVLSVVFGCGGERDRTKRPLMLQEALQYADRVFITLDNPRHESAEQIVADMLQAGGNREKIVIELDRRLAVEQAIRAAGAQDMVLLAGKGHETAQIIGSKSLPFSDITVASAALERRLIHS